MSNQTISRLAKEITNFQQGNDLSLAVGYQESDIRNVKALIIGPPDTPYEYGFFEFALRFGNDYPSAPPTVMARTTNSGRCRFNPNIYAGGKVCLSILGTWRGETSGEEWSSAQGLESILISVQSLMSGNPYENEPGYEANVANSPSDRLNQVAYVNKICHETIRIAVIQKMEQILGVTADGVVKDEPSEEWESEPSSDSEVEARRKRQRREDARVAAASYEPFADLLKQRFLWYYETYVNTCNKRAQHHKVGAVFEQMPFEGGGNSMSGTYNYPSLLTRLHRLKTLIDAETTGWPAQGLVAVDRGLGIASKLSGQFHQLQAAHAKAHMYNVTMSLDGEHANPFLWTLLYFGKPGSDLDGGVFKLRIFISPTFPDEQPRVRVETPLFHHRISAAGVLCYFPRKNKSDDIAEHVRAILEALEETEPSFDPRAIVRPDASRLLWGDETEKKRYKRMVRRSAEESMEVS